MAIYSKEYQSDASSVYCINNGVVHECSKVLEVINGVIKEVWDYITGYLFTSDNYVYQTSDGYLYKCSDQ